MENNTQEANGSNDTNDRAAKISSKNQRNMHRKRQKKL